MKPWLKRLLLAVPFVLAAVLNSLMWASDHYHWLGQLMFRYVLLFGLPWARLLGEIGVPNPRSHLAQVILGYALVLWIPAALYCLCVWIVLRVIQSWITLFHRRDPGGAPGKDRPS